jgi:predicted O-methyltransferase YrrM
MIPYIGDVSRADAELLRKLAERAPRILEFGSGASTQIFAAYGIGTVVSVETDDAWILKTRENLCALGIPLHRVSFRRYGEQIGGEFDMIFVDGIDELRLPFALEMWQRLAIDGAMCLHDTRRSKPHGKAKLTDAQNACAIVEKHFLEIECVEVNRDGSNITAIWKREPVEYVHWGKAEGRTPQQMGLA